mmetsp:Transcript_413/g.1427  ORF Transcript_413/g.1427 Transcript_413/m.1427 type:complete len:177 (+) Transcript_413:93-623(+)
MSSFRDLLWVCLASVAALGAVAKKAPSVVHKLETVGLPVHSFPFIDSAKLIEEDAARIYNSSEPFPTRVGVPIDDDSIVGLDLLQSGLWTELPNGEGSVLRYSFESKGAHSIQLNLEDARFPAPMQLFIFSDTYVLSDSLIQRAEWQAKGPMWAHLPWMRYMRGLAVQQVHAARCF